MLNIFEGKQLVFLEKDYKCPSSDDCIESGKRFLSIWLKVPEKQIDEMIIHYQFHLKDRGELLDILFNPNNIIVTHSVYVHGSDALFNTLMSIAGSNDRKGLFYIDCSGALTRTLNRKLNNVENKLFNIIAGINANNIITINYCDDNPNPKLLKVEIKGIYDDCVTLKDLTDNNILKYKK